MQGRNLIPAILLLVGFANGPLGASPAVPVTQEEMNARYREIRARVDSHSDPKADADAAVEKHDFGLLGSQGRVGEPRPVGVLCFTPQNVAPQLRASIFFGDVIDEAVAAWNHYADSYNQVVVEHPDYPDADLCRVARPEDYKRRRPEVLVTQPARTVSRPPLSLHEAARRGSAADVRKLLDNADVNALDGIHMTPLAWAVARNNLTAIRLLIEAGANPWLDGYGMRSAVYWAAVVDNPEVFDRLALLPGKPFEKWPRYLVQTAAGRSDAILEAMLAQPHEDLQWFSFPNPLPSLKASEAVLKEQPDLAGRLLSDAVFRYEPSPEHVALALGYGADPDKPQGDGRGYNTPLGEAAQGMRPESVAMVDLLLKGGADPNHLSGWDMPIWRSVKSLTLFSGSYGAVAGSPEIPERATTIFHRLVRAGADLNLPDAKGVPPIRSLLFPARYDRNTLDGGGITPELLRMLVANGLDLNAEWQGGRVLPLVEAQAGRDSPLAKTLRDLGAKP
jgi:ankyrin repeat protein